MSKNKTNHVFVILAAVLILITLAACGSKKDKQAALETKLVDISTVRHEKMALLSELSAALEPGEESSASFEVAGRILEMTRKEGDQVGAGEVLARLDATDYSLQVNQTGTALDKAQVAYQQAKDDLSRAEQLFKQSVIASVDYESAQNRFAIAERDYFQARQAYGLISPDKSLLKSPISGTVIAKLSSVGQLVGVGTTIYRVGQIDPLKLKLPVPDRDILSWHTGDVITLSLYQEKREGKVVRIYPTTNQGTGTISVEVEVPNPRRDWFPGQVVNASRTAAVKEGLFVPVEAVLSRGEGQPYVFLAVGDRAVKTFVTTGEIFNNQFEILSGVKDGEQIVVKGADRLFDGDLIKQAGGA
jgi:RND family efflux transporter MFP subunit